MSSLWNLIVSLKNQYPQAKNNKNSAFLNPWLFTQSSELPWTWDVLQNFTSFTHIYNTPKCILNINTVRFPKLHSPIYHTHAPWQSQLLVFQHNTLVTYKIPCSYLINDNHICQVSPQLCCGDTWQMWLWLQGSNLCFCINTIYFAENLMNRALVPPTRDHKDNTTYEVTW